MLEVKGLKLTLNGKPIINGLNLEVKKGKIHGLLGVNGTGKTTLANLLMGIAYPDEGSIIFEGRDITKGTISERARMGITLAWQEPARFEGLSIREYLKLSRNLDSNESESYLWMVGLPPVEYLNRAVDVSLSGGERKRVELASVLAMKPKVAILDEPDSGIDVVSLPHIMNGIVEMSKQGSAVLLITHSETAVEIANRVSVMCAGKIINTGAPEKMCQWFKDNCQLCGHIGEPGYEGA
ncbi:MAG: ATP-binding cassette domain-containing protein [Dehalococcoidia bacterium]|nr:ATP-binding cassette domain-containing protein [Dehalococcoidia bacterium]MDH5781311.1 ATP-binding cassette domain-containing protein [Dehalococcoidia bacterium]